jgi:hypothetical protein
MEVTGAPKISAMKIIDDLEETKEDYTAEQWVILRQMEISILMLSGSVLYNQKCILFCRKRHNSLVNSRK